MHRVIGLVVGVVSMSWSVASGGEPKKAAEGAEPDGYVKITLEAKGRLSLEVQGEGKTIKGIHLKGVFPFWRPTPLANDKKLHDAARELDGQLVIVTGVGEPYVVYPTGARDGEQGVRLLITGIRAASEKK